MASFLWRAECSTHNSYTFQIPFARNTYKHSNMKSDTEWRKQEWRGPQGIWSQSGIGNVPNKLNIHFIGTLGCCAKPPWHIYHWCVPPDSRILSPPKFKIHSFFFFSLCLQCIICNLHEELVQINVTSWSFLLSLLSIFHTLNLSLIAT